MNGYCGWRGGDVPRTCSGKKNRVRLSGREEIEGTGQHQKEAKRMGRGYRGEERPRELGRDKMEVKRMVQDYKGRKRAEEGRGKREGNWGETKKKPREWGDKVSI